MNYNNVLRCFPSNLKNIVEKGIRDSGILENLEEIRVRSNLPLIIRSYNKERVLNYIVTREEINEIVQRICENSLYSYQKQIINRIYHNSWRQ